MEACLIKKNKNVIVTFYLLCDINSQSHVIKWELWDINSQFCEINPYQKVVYFKFILLRPGFTDSA